MEAVSEKKATGTREVKPIIGMYDVPGGLEQAYVTVPTWPKGITDMQEAAKAAAGIQTQEIVDGKKPSDIKLFRFLGTAEAEIKTSNKFRIA